MKKVRKILLIFLGICLACTTVSCAKRTEVKKGDSYIYCLNSDRTGLQKVSYESKEKDPLKAAKAMIKELKKPSEEIEYTPPIPKDVKVKRYELEGGILYLDFNAKYKQMDTVEGINSVWIKVEGANLTDSSGQVLGYLNEDDFVQSEGASPSSYQTGTLTLYFSNEAGDALVEQTMEVRYNSNISKEKLIVEKLMKGPETSVAKATINPDTNLLSVTTKDGICYVNFDKTFLKGAYDVKPQVTIYSLVNSLTQGTGVRKVQISINGENDVKYMQTVDLSQPLEADLGWNEEKK